jgi:hypothetical protein
VALAFVHRTSVVRWRVAERQPADQAPNAGYRDDVADVPAILRRADQIGVDPWRVLVALEIPPSARRRLLQEIDGDDGGLARRQPGRSDDPG